MHSSSTSNLFGFRILAVQKTEFFSYLDELIEKNQHCQTQLIMTPNSEQVVLARHDRAFAANLQKADWLLPDGSGLVWAASILKFFGKLERRIIERIAGVEVVEYLLQKNLKTLIIGGRDYLGSYQGEFYEDQKSLKVIKPNLFWTEAYQEKTDVLPIEEAALVKIISKLKPELVFVALGAPDQERWLIEHRALLEQNQVKIAMAVGGSFDFIFAKVQRAPRFWQQLGMEWLWRLIKQPWRGKRQLKLLEYIYLVAKAILPN